jgi:hypothetical protein
LKPLKRQGLSSTQEVNNNAEVIPGKREPPVEPHPIQEPLTLFIMQRLALEKGSRLL